MKKILSFIFICTFIFVLVGCGKKEDTLTCTKGSDKIVITFKNDMTTKISTTQTFNNEDSAKEFEEILKANPSKEVKFKRNGKKVTITVTGEALKKEKLYGSKESVKGFAELEEFNCK